MAVYTFTLDSFHIDNTRSRHEDTVSVVFIVQPPYGAPLLLRYQAGDVNNGDHSVGLSSAPVFVTNDDRPVVFGYVFYNGDTSSLSVPLDDMATKIVEDYFKQITEGGPSGDPTREVPDDPQLPDNATFTDTSWVNVLVLAELASLLFPDCDGVVAADGIARTKVELDNALDASDGMHYRQTRRYPGTDSPPGCGSNSNYTVSWSVRRYRFTGIGAYSVKDFLRYNELNPSPGLRSLSPGNRRMSLRDLVS